MVTEIRWAPGAHQGHGKPQTQRAFMGGTYRSLTNDVSTLTTTI